MQISRLSILNFKNISEAELGFSPGLNCLVGRNGEGKTNLLDALYYLAFCKSHNNPIDTHNINHDADFFMIQAEIHTESATMEVHCAVKRRQKKVFKFKKDVDEFDIPKNVQGIIPINRIWKDGIFLIGKNKYV